MKTDGVEIHVQIIMPWAKESKHYCYMVDAHDARDSLAPLPREREIDYYSAMLAQDHRKKRTRLIDLVAGTIASALITACESEDTDHGYPKNHS